jgi:prophage antirepressor-like protein
VSAPLQAFEFGGKAVRVAGTPEAPLFCAADICEVLTLGDVSKACQRLDQDEVVMAAHAAAEKSHERLGSTAGGRAYKSLYVTESGLYSLIIGCEKPQAKPFKKWVTAEVLPAIRKYGYYSAVESALQKTAAQLLAACFPSAPAKAKPIFSELISALLKMRNEAPVGNPAWAPLLASIVYGLAIPVDGQQQKRRALNKAPSGNRLDHSMFSPELKAHVIDIARAGIALAKNSSGWAEWRARMETAFADAPLQLSLLTPVRRLPKKAAK